MELCITRQNPAVYLTLPVVPDNRWLQLYQVLSFQRDHQPSYKGWSKDLAQEKGCSQDLKVMLRVQCKPRTLQLQDLPQLHPSLRLPQTLVGRMKTLRNAE